MLSQKEQSAFEQTITEKEASATIIAAFQYQKLKKRRYNEHIAEQEIEEQKNPQLGFSRPKFKDLLQAKKKL